MKSASNPFYKKRFFLDIKGCPPDIEKNLVKDLKFLGAKEAFHCKDASFAVSNKAPLQIVSWSPTTPKTANSPCHSPQLLSDNAMDLGSPENTYSPFADKKAVSLVSQSRGKFLLQKSQQIIKKQGTTDTLAVCKQYGVKVYSIEKVLSYVKKIKNICGAKKISTNQEKPTVKSLNKLSSNNEVQKIRAPFVKIEDIKRKYRTRHRVFSSWADIVDPALSQSVKELHKNFSINGCIEHQTLFRPILKDVNNFQKGSPNHPFLMPLTPSCTKSFTRQSTTQASILMSVDNRKKPETVHCVEDRKRCKRKKKKQYCEICGVYYSNLDEHIGTKFHLNFMSNSCNYIELEQLITEIPKFTDIIQIQEEVLRSNSESRFLSNDTYCSYLGDTSFVVQQATPLFSEKIDNTQNLFSSSSSEFATELYDLDDSIISGSCTTASTGFPFLEDKWELDVSPEIPIQCPKSCLNDCRKQPEFNDSIILDTFQTVDIKVDSNLDKVNDGILECANLQTDVSFLKASCDTSVGVCFDKLDEVPILSPPNNNDVKAKTLKYTDFKDLLISMSESFEKCLSPQSKRSKSKKRKRGEDLESYMLKKFLCDELPFHISDTSQNVADDASRDSGLCSAMIHDQSALQHVVADDASRDSGLCSAMIHDQSALHASVPVNSTDSNQATDLSVFDSSRCPSNFNLEVSIPITALSSSSLSPPMLDLYPKGIPLLTTISDFSDCHISPPTLSVELPIICEEELNRKSTSSIHTDIPEQAPVLAEFNSNVVDISKISDCTGFSDPQIALPILGVELLNISAEKLAQKSNSVSFNEENVPEEAPVLTDVAEFDLNAIEISKIPAYPNALDVKIPNFETHSIEINTTLHVPNIDNHIGLKHSQIAILKSQKMNDPFIAPDANPKAIYQQENKHKCQSFYKTLRSLDMEKLLLYKDCFLYCFCKNSDIVPNSESILQKLVSISSQFYTSYYIKNFGEIYISHYQNHFSGNIILRLDPASDSGVSNADGIYKAFIILSACGKKPTYKFVKQQLEELSLLCPPTLIKLLTDAIKFVKNKFCLWLKYLELFGSSDCAGKHSDGISNRKCVNSSYRTNCHLCSMPDSFTPCDSPSCLEKGSVVLKLVDLIKLRLIYRKNYNSHTSKTSVSDTQSSESAVDLLVTTNLNNDFFPRKGDLSHEAKTFVSGTQSSESAVDLSVTTNLNNDFFPRKGDISHEATTFVTGTQSSQSVVDLAVTTNLNDDFTAIGSEHDTDSAGNVELKLSGIELVDVPLSSNLEPSSCFSISRYDSQESMVDGQEYEGEYILVDKPSYSDEIDWSELEREVKKKCLNPYSSEY